MAASNTDKVDGGLAKGPFRVGAWTVEPALHRLTRDDRTIRVEPRVMDLLVCLASRAGTPISRQELHETVWADVVVGDEALTMAISKLRRALDDSSQAPQLVETIAKIGYRLMVPVEPLPARPEAGRRASRPLRRAWLLWIPGILLILSLYFTTTSIRRDRLAPTSPPEPTQILRLTSLPGVESQAVVSPDGTRVAFVRHGPEEPAPGVYTMTLENGAPRRLTEGQESSSPAWSPDGRRIAFTSCTETGCELLVVAAHGGPPRKLASIAPSPLTGIDWAPTGNTIALALLTSERTTYAVYEIDVESGRRHQLTEPPAGLFDARPTYSPDGRQIAFSRGKSVRSQDLFVVPREGGTVRQLTAEKRRLWGFDWLGDGSGLVFSSNRRGHFQLWRIPLGGGEPRWIPVPAEEVRFPAISGSYLTFDQHENIASIWQVVPGETPRLHEAIHSNRHDTSPRHSPDGRRVAFVSNRSDSVELWLADEMNEPRRLSDLGATFMRRPEWSADGRHLAIAAVVDAIESSYIIDAETGATWEVDSSPHGGRSTNPAWSADGTSIYFASDRAGTWNLWRIPATGGGKAEVVVAGGYLGVEATDGETLFFVRAGKNGLWRQALGDGSVSLVTDDFAFGNARSMILMGDAIYYPESTNGDWKLMRIALESGDRSELMPLSRSLASGGTSISPIDGSVLYSEYERAESDIVLITNFH